MKMERRLLSCTDEQQTDTYGPRRNHACVEQQSRQSQNALRVKVEQLERNQEKRASKFDKTEKRDSADYYGASSFTCIHGYTPPVTCSFHFREKVKEKTIYIYRRNAVANVKNVFVPQSPAPTKASVSSVTQIFLLRDGSIHRMSSRRAPLP